MIMDQSRALTQARAVIGQSRNLKEIIGTGTHDSLRSLVEDPVRWALGAVTVVPGSSPGPDVIFA